MRGCFCVKRVGSRRLITIIEGGLDVDAQLEEALTVVKKGGREPYLWNESKRVLFVDLT